MCWGIRAYLLTKSNDTMRLASEMMPSSNLSLSVRDPDKVVSISVFAVLHILTSLVASIMLIIC